MKVEDIFDNDPKTNYKGRKVYRDVADNLAKIPFPVIVTEAYNPNVHWSYLREGAPPPIFNPSDGDEFMQCHAMLPGDFIVDALVNNQFLSFENPDDMNVLASWLEQYIDSYKGIDLTRFPDRQSFLENCKRALGMMRGNLERKRHWEREVDPAPLTLAEIISYM